MVYFPQNTQKIFPEQVVENLAPDEVLLDRALGGEAKYGKLHMREDRIDLLEAWLRPNDILEEVKAIPSITYVMPTKGKYHPASNVGVRIDGAFGYINMRDVGKFMSIGRNAEEHLMDFWRSKEGEAFAVKYAKELSKAGEIDYIAVGVEPKDALYGVARLPDGNILFFVNANAYKTIHKWADIEGLPDESLFRRAMAEEVFHTTQKGKPAIEHEKEVRIELIKLYNSLAQSTSDEKSRARYGAIARHLQRDLNTVEERYADSYNLKGLIDLYTSDLGKLELMLEAEAVMEEGITDAKEVKDYVEGRLEEIAEAAESEDGAEGVEALAADGECSDEGAADGVDSGGGNAGGGE